MLVFRLRVVNLVFSIYSLTCDEADYIILECFDDAQSTLKEETFAEETFASGKIREIFGRNFREFCELANFGFFARIIFREFMLLIIFLVSFYSYWALLNRSFTVYINF